MHHDQEMSGFLQVAKARLVHASTRNIVIDNNCGQNLQTHTCGIHTDEHSRRRVALHASAYIGLPSDSMFSVMVLVLYSITTHSTHV